MRRGDWGCPTEQAQIENGRIFKIGDSAHFSFKETIPIWCYNTLTVSLERVHETDEIGEYLTPYLG